MFDIESFAGDDVIHGGVGFTLPKGELYLGCSPALYHIENLMFAVAPCRACKEDEFGRLHEAQAREIDG